MTKFEFRGGDYAEILALLKKHGLYNGYHEAFEFVWKQLQKATSGDEQENILISFGAASIALGRALERAEATGAEVVR